MMGEHEIRLVTSSASQPSVVATVLDRLNLAPGQRVLEIGTGTGYNAALLGEYLADPAAVVSVEIDPDLTQAARDVLYTAGYRPTVIHGDGSSTSDIAGPFDRIIATCAVDHLPDYWIGWLAPGGRLVTPSSTGNALLVLEKGGPARLEGRVDSFSVTFMSLRSSPHIDARDGSAYLVGSGNEHQQLRPTVDPAVLSDPSFQFWLVTVSPGVRLALGSQPVMARPSSTPPATAPSSSTHGRNSDGASYRTKASSGP